MQWNTSVFYISRAIRNKLWSVEKYIQIEDKFNWLRAKGSFIIIILLSYICFEVKARRLNQIFICKSDCYIDVEWCLCTEKYNSFSIPLQGSRWLFYTNVMAKSNHTLIF